MKWREVPSVGSGMAVAASCSSSFDWQLVSLFWLFISQSLSYSKRSGNSNYPPSKERAGRRETNQGREERSTDTRNPSWILQVWEEGLERWGTDTSVCWQTCEGVVILHQLNRMPRCNASSFVSMSLTRSMLFLCIICWFCEAFVYTHIPIHIVTWYTV